MRISVDWLYSWSKKVRGAGMVRLQVKLENLKQVSKQGNRTVLHDVKSKVRLATYEVNRIQQLIDLEGFSDVLYAQDLVA